MLYGKLAKNYDRQIANPAMNVISLQREPQSKSVMYALPFILLPFKVGTSS